MPRRPTETFSEAFQRIWTAQMTIRDAYLATRAKGDAIALTNAAAYNRGDPPTLQAALHVAELVGNDDIDKTWAIWFRSMRDALTGAILQLATKAEIKRNEVPSIEFCSDVLMFMCMKQDELHKATDPTSDVVRQRLYFTHLMQSEQLTIPEYIATELHLRCDLCSLTAYRTARAVALGVPPPRPHDEDGKWACVFGSFRSTPAVENLLGCLLDVQEKWYSEYLCAITHVNKQRSFTESSIPLELWDRHSPLTTEQKWEIARLISLGSLDWESSH